MFIIFIHLNCLVQNFTVEIGVQSLIYVQDDVVMGKFSYRVFNQFIIMLSCYIISSGYHCISEVLRRVSIYLWLLELDNF